jgi:hypothetical protein
VIDVSADCVNALIEVNELSVDDVNEFIAFNELSVEDVNVLIDEVNELYLLLIDNCDDVNEFNAVIDVSTEPVLLIKEDILLSTDAEYVVTLPIPLTVEDDISPFITLKFVPFNKSNEPLIVVCPTIVCTSVISSPITLLPLENITDADSSVT